MTYIDIHAHAGDFPRVFVTGNNVSSLLETAEPLGIGKLCISHFIAQNNELTAGNSLTMETIREFPDRLAGCAVINPNFPAAEIEKEIRRCREWAAIWAIHPSQHQEPANSRKYREILEMQADSGIPLLIHIEQPDENSRLERVFDLLSDVRNVIAVLSHSGSSIAGISASLDAAKTFENIYFDTAYSPAFFGLIKGMINIVGADRILFGSNAPLGNPAAQLAKVLHADISDEAREKILSKNAVRILDLS